jgi:putative RecB family exonuclease
MIRLPQLPNGRPTNPNDIAEAMTGRRHISYSEVRTFQSCPLRWHFHYVEKATPESVSSALLLGASVHAAVELHFQSLLDALPAPTLDQLMTTYREAWTRESADVPVHFPKSHDADGLEVTARRMLEQFQASPWSRPTGQIVGVEEEFRIHLAQDLPDLVGRVDMITHDAERNELVITDFKTARSMYTEEAADDQAEQLILYAQGCEPIARDLNATVRLQFIVVTKTKEPKVEAVPVAVDASLIARTRMIIRRVFQAMQSGTVYPVPSQFHCTGCPHQDRCSNWR